MTNKQRVEWDAMQYRAKLAANRGHNYPYWNNKFDERLENGWVIYIFRTHNNHTDEFTSSESEAKTAKQELIAKGHKATIVCGYEKIAQKIKYYTLIYKSKTN